jgi:transposase
VQQIQAGAHPEAIAGALGLARSTVFGWMARYREGGLEALRAKPVLGYEQNRSPSL